MQTEKKLFVPLFITIVMVVGAFAAMVPAPGTMSAVGDRESSPSTRSGEMADMTILDAMMKEQEALQPDTENSMDATDKMPVAGLVEEEGQRAEVTDPVSRIKVTANEAQGTRGPGVDAGGPYGGASTYEGTLLTLTATVDDPSLIFFRWDLDNDGVFDTAWEMSLTMSHSIDWMYDDDYFGDITVEAWDGVSTYTLVHSGDIWGGDTSYTWYFNPATVGSKFMTKKAIVINQLGFYRSYPAYIATRMSLWHVDSGSELRRCDATLYYYSWNWCSIAPYTLTVGEEYIISFYKGQNTAWPTYRYMFGDWWDAAETDNDFYKMDSFTYKWYPFGFPGAEGGTDSLPFVDMKWSLVEILPLTESDTAFVEVNNIAPSVFNVQTDPPLAYEGTATSFTAQFNDGGKADDWWYRWDFGDGDISPWFKVNKMLGGARVLYIEAYVGTQDDSFIQGARDAGGEFFTAWDEWTYGPAGTGVPSVEYMSQYDVILIGSNYYVYEEAYEVGDNLADFMDLGGAVVAMTWCCNPAPGGGINGRYFDDGYSPVELAANYYGWTDLDMIYAPGHDLFNGVTTISTYYSHRMNTLNPGATMLADYTNGYIMAAENTNPIVPNGAISMFLNFALVAGYSGGDISQIIANAIIYASQADWPVPLPMPLTTDPVTHVYRDDHPTTTSPTDDVDVRVEVKDDDHEKLKGGYETLLFEDFQSASGNSQPAGWTTNPGYYGDSWRFYNNYYFSPASIAAMQYYYYIYTFPDYWAPKLAMMTAPTLDLSAKPWVEMSLSWRNTWYTFGSYDRDGYVEVSTDGGSTWTVLEEFHLNDPYYEPDVTYTHDLMWAAGSPDFRLRFRLLSEYNYAYYLWAVDDVRIEAAWGTPIWGLGEAPGDVSIANVQPTVHAGPTSGLLTESDVFDFFGYKLSDPALWEPTEWFAYKWDFDDGTGTDWVYKGSLAPPELDVLIIESCWNDQSCYNGWARLIEGQDLVGNVEYWGYYDNYPNFAAPPLSYMMEFDVIFWGTWYGNFVDPRWPLAKRQTGDRMADYMDAGRGAIITHAPAYGNNIYGQDTWKLLGRFIDDEYGPFESDTYWYYEFGLGTVYDPDHQTMNDKFVITSMSSGSIHSGDHDLTPGGIAIADWTDDGRAVGVKEHPNGARTVHFGGMFNAGGQAVEFHRNAMAWGFGKGIPTDDIWPLSHQYGDNGVYDVDITVIDDDMGWTWDLLGNQPVMDPMYVQSESHYGIPITVDNVDPTIGTQSIEVYIPAEFCLRVSGKEWHRVSMTTLVDGVYVDDVVLERQPGDPNDQVLCTMVKVDLSVPHLYSYVLDYIPFADMSGSNPSWVIISPWREPITPGHGTVTYKHTFQTGDPSTWIVNMDLPDLKTDLMDGGHGAKIAFEATASDPGTDDLAFLWIWGDQTPYGIHIHHNNGMPVSEGANTNPEDVGFSEPAFEKAANDIRSPHGTTNFVTRDIAYHMFEQGYYYYVTLIVMDDDVNDPYASPFGHPGIDMEFIDLDLR